MKKLKKGDKVRVLCGRDMDINRHVVWNSDTYGKVVGLNTYITQEPIKSGDHWYYKLNIDGSNRWFVEDWLEKVED